MVRRALGVALGVALGGAALAAAPRVATADDNDLVLARLATRTDNGAGGLTIVPQNADYRGLASQLGVVLAPHLLTPADTLGFGGFQLTADYTNTTIDPDAPFWRARVGSPDPGGLGGMAHGPSSLQTIGLFARKGMWFPAPAFELGAGAVHLVDSTIWAAQFYAKLALHEGYHRRALPSFAVRAGVSRMMNQHELDLTVISLDAMLSKQLAIGGTWRFHPFAGWNVLLIVPRSEVIDPTPEIDPLVPGQELDAQLSFTFQQQDNILRNRLVVGAKLHYYFLQLTIEAGFALAGGSVDDRPGISEPCLAQSDTTNCDAEDPAAAQRTLSVSAGFDF